MFLAPIVQIWEALVSHLLRTLEQYHERNPNVIYTTGFFVYVTAIGINIKWWKYHLEEWKKMRFVIFRPEDLKDYGGIDKNKMLELLSR